jgi:S-adenosylmethionine:tRNA-ribosyltransferase-isomerase (queuine synthetase)
LVEKGDNNGSIVKFKWDGDKSFSEVLDICGRIPIPPYLKRDTEDLDYERYQTLYAKIKGSVAAPTAGLHFTDKVLSDIDALNIKRDTVCLHVGAGTFVPVKSEYISDHKMHSEPFEVTKRFFVRFI